MYDNDLLVCQTYSYQTLVLKNLTPSFHCCNCKAKSSEQKICYNSSSKISSNTKEDLPSASVYEGIWSHKDDG